MGCNIEYMTITPEDRQAHIEYMRNKVDGLNDVRIKSLINAYQQRLFDSGKSNSNSATLAFLDQILTHLERTGQIEAKDCFYAGLALTHVPAEQRKAFLEKHGYLKEAIAQAGKKIYDPAEAPFNPQADLVGDCTDIYDIDTLMVAASRGFTLTDIAPTTGGGIETRTANVYNKFPFNFMENGLRMSRMIIGARRVIHVGYDDVVAQRDEIADLVGRVTSFNPGIGYCTEHGNTLVGQDDQGLHHCLVGLVKKRFPGLAFDFSQYTK